MEKTKRYKIAVIVGTVLVALLTLMTAYFTAFASNNLKFGVEWNMFNSILILPLYIVGLVGAFKTKIRGSDPIIKTTYRDGRSPTYEKDNDLISWMFGHLILPGLMRFLFIPCAIAALIYYPLMLAWSLVGIILPYILAIAMLVIPILYHSIASKQILISNRHLRLPFLTLGFVFVLFFVYQIWTSFGGIGYYGEYTSSDIQGFVCLGAFTLFVISFLILVLTAEEDRNMELIKPEPMSKGTRISLIGGGLVVSTLIVLGVIYYPSSSSNYDYTPDLPTYTHSVNASSLNVRSTASAVGVVVGKLTRDEKVNVREIMDDWAVIDHDGSTAYISVSYITALEPTDNTLLASGINIPKMTGRMSTLAMGWQDYMNEMPLSQSEIKRLKLPPLEADQFYVKGKKIHECVKGRLETHLLIAGDHLTEECLVSYDNDGNQIDKLAIGGIMSYSGDRMYGELEGNLITLHNDYPGEEEDEETYSTTKYKITDDLKFVQLINN